MGRSPLLSACIIGAFVSPAVSLEFAAICRGPTATITEIDGLDTTRARAIAHYTVPDAISHCHYTLGRQAGKPNPKAPAMRSCVEDFMRDAAKEGALTVEANCRTGTIGIPDLKPKNALKLPLGTSCAEGGTQAADLFQVLCPSYDGKIKENDY